ncbi:MAG TPA: dipeptidase [Gemmatimonadales bacterium]|nr:dipeptidase [Gemmatimonadales bacterium]
MALPIVVDGHLDTPQRMLDEGVDIATRLPDGHVDLPRMREGGLSAAFFAIWVDATYGPGTAYARATALIDVVSAFADGTRGAELVTGAAGVRRAAAAGRIAVLLGVEGGHAIENSLENLAALYRRGVRYLTLVWNNGNDWAGASLDPRRPGGLTSFGREVVRRMGELGMLVDLSHASDATFRDALDAARGPVIASHSACRALAAHPRNLTDEQLRAIAKRGGVVGINFFPVFLDDGFRAAYENLNRRLEPGFASIRDRFRGRPGAAEFEIDRYRSAQLGGIRIPSVDRLVDHIEHAVRVMGVDHVALGSDFDGISVLPPPMKDATSLPLLVRALGARGMSDSDVAKILGENFLRLL